MSRERRKEHETTPRPNQWRSFRYESTNANKKTSRKINFSNKSDFKDIADIIGEKDDPFHFLSEESDSWQEESDSDPFRFPSGDSDSSQEESDSDDDSWTSTDDDSSLPEAEVFSSPENMRYRESIIWEEEILSPPIFPTKKIVQDLDEENGSPGLTSTKIELPSKCRKSIVDSNMPHLKNVFPMPSECRKSIVDSNNPHLENISPNVQDLDEEVGSPKLSSTKIGCSEDDLQLGIPVHSSTEIGMTSERRENIVDSNNSQMENASPIPVGINENYINIPDCQYLENEDSENTVVDIASENLDTEPHLVLDKGTKDQEHSLKHCQENERLDSVLPMWIENDSQRRHTQNEGISFITAITESDVVDDVFKNSNETSNQKFSDAFVTADEISSEQHSLVAKEMNVPEVSVSPTVKEKMKKSQTFRRKKGRKTPKSFISKRRKTQATKPKSKNEGKKKSFNSDDFRRYEEYLRTLPICPLSLILHPPFSGTEKAENVEGENHFTKAAIKEEVPYLKCVLHRKRNFPDRIARSHDSSEHKKFREYKEEDLKTVPVCPMSLRETPYPGPGRMEV